MSRQSIYILLGAAALVVVWHFSHAAAPAVANAEALKATASLDGFFGSLGRHSALGGGSYRDCGVGRLPDCPGQKV